jgi:hypothetical protein
MNDKPRVKRMPNGYWRCYTPDWLGYGTNMTEAWIDYVVAKHQGMRFRSAAAQILRDRIDRAVALEKTMCNEQYNTPKGAPKLGSPLVPVRHKPWRKHLFPFSFK